MPTPTYTPLATVTLASTASSVTFSNIPATYRDLILVSDTVSASGSADVFYRFNGDTSSSYSRVLMYGDSGGAQSVADSGTGAAVSLIRATNRTLSVVQMMDYTATDKHKILLSRVNENSVVVAYAARWANTAAVTSLSLSPTATFSFGSGSRFDLYGVIA